MRFAICSAAYPEEPAFIADFMAGVAAASRDFPETELVLAVEYGFDECPGLADGVPAPVSVRTRRAPRPTTPAELRGQMLTAASASAADVVVFADFDDRLLPEALGLHARALDDADISFGDMVLADSGGRRLGRRFFDGASIPNSFTGPGAIIERNFLGFGNTAVRRAVLLDADLSIPTDAMPADWWFFTALLSKGLRAARTDGPVSLYRSHANSALGAEAAASAPALRARAALALSHYAQLDGRVDTKAARRAVEDLIRLIDGGDGSFAAVASALDDCPAVWFEDVARAARGIAQLQAGSH
jgi:hypothetical protein